MNRAHFLSNLQVSVISAGVRNGKGYVWLSSLPVVRYGMRGSLY